VKKARGASSCAATRSSETRRNQESGFRYIKEETIQPIKDMGRFVAWGALGSLLVGFATSSCSSAHCDSCKTSSSLGRHAVLDSVLDRGGAGDARHRSDLWRIVTGTAKRRLKDTK